MRDMRSRAATPPPTPPPMAAVLEVLDEEAGAAAAAAAAAAVPEAAVPELGEGREVGEGVVLMTEVMRTMLVWPFRPDCVEDLVIVAEVAGSVTMTGDGLALMVVAGFSG